MAGRGPRPTRYGLYLPTQGPFADVEVLARLAAAAESADWDGFFIWEAVLPIFEHSDAVRRRLGTSRAVADPVVALTAVAVATRRIRFGSLVTPLPRVRPETFALQMATLGALSGGRVIVGAGLGSPDAQFTSFGLEADLRRRAAMADEFLDVVARLWNGGVVDHRGTHYVVTGVEFPPAPPIPVWVGGGAHGRGPRRRAARWQGFVPASDGWPEEVIPAPAYREMASDIAALRERGLEGFDLVVIGNADGTAPGPAELGDYVDAGVNWVLVQAFSVDDALARIAAGPLGSR